MKKSLLALAMIALTATVSIASQPPLDKATQDDIARHRSMAVAHENAAKCLEAGKPDDVCEKQLQIECTGLAIGKFCGMKHVH
jgi:hypothetical protein